MAPIDWYIIRHVVDNFLNDESVVQNEGIHIKVLEFINILNNHIHHQIEILNDGVLQELEALQTVDRKLHEFIDGIHIKKEFFLEVEKLQLSFLPQGRQHFSECPALKIYHLLCVKVREMTKII